MGANSLRGGEQVESTTSDTRLRSKLVDDAARESLESQRQILDSVWIEFMYHTGVMFVVQTQVPSNSYLTHSRRVMVDRALSREDELSRQRLTAICYQGVRLYCAWRREKDHQ